MFAIGSTGDDKKGFVLTGVGMSGGGSDPVILAPEWQWRSCNCSGACAVGTAGCGRSCGADLYCFGGRDGGIAGTDGRARWWGGGGLGGTTVVDATMSGCGGRGGGSETVRRELGPVDDGDCAVVLRIPKAGRG